MRVVMLIAVVLSISLFGCATTTLNDPLDPPLPTLGVTVPDPSIPSNIAAFSGVWRGTIEGSQGRYLGRYLMVVHEIYPTPDKETGSYRANISSFWRSPRGDYFISNIAGNISQDGILRVNVWTTQSKFFFTTGGHIKAYWSDGADRYSNAILTHP
jgi:hypothetical protein